MGGKVEYRLDVLSGVFKEQGLCGHHLRTFERGMERCLRPKLSV